MFNIKKIKNMANITGQRIVLLSQAPGSHSTRMFFIDPQHPKGNWGVRGSQSVKDELGDSTRTALVDLLDDNTAKFVRWADGEEPYYTPTPSDRVKNSTVKKEPDYANMTYEEIEEYEENKKLQKNKNLHKAKEEKNGEFYTQLSDIEKELGHYSEHFRGKVVYLPCDSPRVDYNEEGRFIFGNMFVKYLVQNFRRLGLKKLIATCYKNDHLGGFNDKAWYFIYEGDTNFNGEVDLDEIHIDRLQGDGDFLSSEVEPYWKEADIIVTNPPFSLFREFVATIFKYEKKFLIIGHQNAITYKEVFKLIKENKIWLGYGFNGNVGFFINNRYTDYAKASVHKEGMIRVSGVHWFTNLEIKKRHENLILYKTYNPEEYPKYDNYDAIEVSKTADIPMDYDGVMGVPITFLDKYNPEQFEIIGDSRYHDGQDFPDDINYINGKCTYRRILIKRIK